MKKISYLLFIILISLLWGCKKPGCLGNAGDYITATVTLGTFNKVILENNIDLVLTQGYEEKIVIKAPKNIVPNITTGISNGILTISNSGNCRWARSPGEKVSVQLFFKKINKIIYEGSGDITNTDTLKLDTLQFEANEGAGNVSLTVNNKLTESYVLLENTDIKWHGKTENCIMYNNPKGKTDMSDFSVRNMWVTYGGVVDCYVNVSEYLQAIIEYKGNIYYRGNPVVQASYYNLGRLIQLP
jgi:hypothetical protein